MKFAGKCMELEKHHPEWGNPDSERQTWKKIFINSTSDRKLISKVYQGLKRTGIKKLKEPILKQGTNLNRDYLIEETQMTE